MSGQGSRANPWDLATALASPAVGPGDTVVFLNGTYSGDFVSALAGTEAAPITLKPEAGAAVVIDGALTINGHDTKWQDLEVMYSGWPTRVTELDGSSPADLPIAKNLIVNGPRTRLVNCILHDLSGPAVWTPAVDAELSGCLSFNNGWRGPDRGHGHGLYSQNAVGTKHIAGCVIGPGYSDWGIHIYAEGGSIQGFDLSNNVHFPLVCLVGGSQPVDRLIARRNHLRGRLQLGHAAGIDNLGAILEGNTAVDGLMVSGNWADLQQADNRWNSSGLNEVHVIANAHDPLRALVAIYNAALASTVSVDLSSLGLPPGAYRLRNAQNYLAEWHSFTYSGASVSVPMTGWTVAVPVGASAALVGSTFPAFGCFVLEPA